MKIRSVGKVIAMALAGGAFCVDAVADECHEYKLLFVPKATTEVNIDGKLDDAEWKNAAVTTDFGPTSYSYGTNQALPPTEVRMMWDEKYVYVSAICHEDTPENMASFRIQSSDRSGTVFNRDSIEFYMNGGVPGEYPLYQSILAAIPNGQILKSYDEGFGLQRDPNFGRNAQWKKAYSIGKDYWIVEARFAHSSFGTEGRVGYRLGFNVGRLRFNKNFVTTDGDPTSIRFAQIFCWGNRKQYQGATRNSRAIFVEKMPKSVAEGLALSYPDLKSRKILVQTDSAYVVVENGKVFELGYLDKANSLVKESIAAYERLWTLTNNVPAPSKGFYESVYRTSLSNLTKLKERGEFFAKATSCDVGDLDALVAFSAKVKADIENDYYAALRALMLHEGKVRYPVALKYDPKAPTLKDQYIGVKPLPWERTIENTPAWLKPSVAGRKKVLATIGNGDVYAAWELMHRLDVDIDVFVVENQQIKQKVVRPSKEYHYTDAEKLAMLENLLVKNNYDGYLFIGCDPVKWPVKYQCALSERLLQGAKCVTVNGTSWGYRLKKDNSLLSGIPSLVRVQKKTGSMFETEKKPCIFPEVLSCDVGKGSYSMWNPGKGSGYREHTSFLPGWSFASGDLISDEYCYAAGTRVVAKGLGLVKEDTFVKSVSVCKAEPNQKFKVLANVKVKEGENVNAVLVLRGAKGKSVAPVVCRAKASTGHVTFEAPGIETGKYFADVFLVDGDCSYDGYAFTKGKVCDFASSAFEVRPSFAGACNCSPLCNEKRPAPVITSLAPRKNMFKPTEKIDATLVVSNAIEGLKVKVDLIDVRERIIEKGEFSVDAKTGIARIAFSSARLTGNAHFLAAKVYGADGVCYGEAKKEFYRKRGRPDDFTVFTDGFEQGGINGWRRQTLLEWYCIDLCQGGSPTRLLNGGDAALRDRIAGGHAEDGGSLASPAFLKKMGERFRKNAQKIVQHNGLLISCGDDSSVPHSFSADTPDWVPIFWRMVEDEVWARVASGEKLRNVTLDWSSSRNIKVRGSTWNIHWGFLNELQPANCLPKLINARLYPQDIENIRKACRIAYAGPKAIEYFNRQNGMSITKWEDITIESLKNLKPAPSTTFVHFQFWLRDSVYGGKIEKLNAAWHSKFKCFFDITQEDIVSLKDEGKIAGELDRRRFMRKLLNDEFTTVRTEVDKVEKGLPVFMGCTHYHNSIDSVRKLGSTCPYWTSLHLTKRFRRMVNEGGLVGTTLGVYYSPKKPREQRDSDVWRSVFSGNNLCWFWSTFVSFRGDLGVQDGTAGFTCEALREVKRGPASLMRRSRRENDGIYLLYDTESAALDGIYTDFGKTEDSANTWQLVLDDICRSYDWLLDGDLEKGVLKKKDVKILILPCLQLLNGKQTQAIRDFVKNGGVVITDARPAFLAANGDKLEKGMLDDVFGIDSKTYKCPENTDVVNLDNVKINTYGKGRAVFLNFTPIGLRFACEGKDREKYTQFVEDLLMLANVAKPRCIARWEDGSRVGGIEISPFVRNNAWFLGIEKLPVSGEKLPRKGYFDFGGVKAWTYDIRTGEDFGFVDKLPFEFKGFDTRFISRLPYQVKGVKIDAPAEIERGKTLTIKAALETSEKKPSAIATHVLRVELIPPGGLRPDRYTQIPFRLVDAKGGKVSTSFAIAWNEAVEYFTLEVTDIATGKKSTQKIVIK
ncbi:MAG: hypothetical protein J6V88_01895 [Kiritimatiellae bacterium]|nr:hypothetical protein [Kiritimatiellia bacterium]